MRTLCALRMMGVRQKLGLGALLLALLLASGCGGQDRRVAVNHLNAGIQKFQDGQIGSAVSELERARDTDPTFAEPALYLGDIYHQQLRQLDAAEQAYRVALQRDAQNNDTYYKLGAVLHDQGRYAEAIGLLEQAVQRDEAYAKAWFRLGLSHQAKGEYAQAVDALGKAIRANPRMKMDKQDPGGAAYHALGDLYARFGFYDKALHVYKNGVLNNAESAQLYAGQGFAQQKLKRPADAEASLARALELEPNNVAATFNMAVVKAELGQHAGAVKVLESYLSRAQDPDRRQAAEGLLQQLSVKQVEGAEAAR